MSLSKLNQNEFLTLIALLEWTEQTGTTFKTLFDKLRKMPSIQAVLNPPEEKPPAGKKKAKKKAKPKDPLTATAFGKKVRNTLVNAYRRAKHEALLDKGMKIKEWVRAGELDDAATGTDQVIRTAARLLDQANAADIVGRNLFLGQDGRYYTVHVEAVIDEAGDEFAHEVLDEVEAELDAELAEDEGEDVEEHDGGVPGYADEGKPLVDVLDVSGTETFRSPGGGFGGDVAKTLDAVEEQAVAGADRIARDRAEQIRQVAAHARGMEAGDVPDDEIVTAWDEYGGYHLPTLKIELEDARKTLDAAGGRGVELAERIDKMAMVVDLREQGLTEVAETLEEAAALAGPDASAKAVSEQAATVAALAVDGPVTPDELKGAIETYGDWDLATLRDHRRQLREKFNHSGGLGEDLRDELRAVEIAAAVLEWMAKGDDTDVGVPEPGVGGPPAGE